MAIQSSIFLPFFVEVLGLIVITIYCGLTAWQAYETRKAAEAATTATNTSMSTYEATVRPYVETSGISTNTKYDPVMFTLSAGIKNYGSIPAQNLKTQIKVVYDGREMPQTKEHDVPGILPPGETSYVLGNFGTTDAPDVISGKKSLTIYSTYSYNWRDKSDAGCSKYSYYPPAHVFWYLGPTCYPN